MKIRAMLSVAVMSLLIGCSSTPSVTSPSTSSSGQATMARTAPAAATVPAATTAVTVPVISTSGAAEQSTTTAITEEEFFAEQILTIFQEEYGSLFDVSRSDKDFLFEPTGDDFLEELDLAFSGKTASINELNGFAEGLADVTSSFPEELSDYSVNVLDPNDEDNSLFVAKEGELLYSFLDEIEPESISDIEDNLLGLFEKYYGEDYDIRLKDTTFYLDPKAELITTGILLTAQGQKMGLDFWADLTSNFNVLSANFPVELKEYSIYVTNPADSSAILFVSKEGQTFYDAFME